MSYEFDSLFAMEAQKEVLPTMNDLLKENAKKKEDEQVEVELLNVSNGVPEHEEIKEKDIDIDVKQEKQIEKEDTREQTRSKKSSSVETCQIRNFPKSLMKMIKQTFPDEPHTKAVAAFVYANRDMELEIDYSDIPKDVIELANSIDKFKKISDTEKNIKRINDGIRQLNEASDDLKLALSYLVYDRSGFRISVPQRPSEIDFLEPGVQEVTKKIEKTSDLIRKEKKYQEGRPKRQNKYMGGK